MTKKRSFWKESYTEKVVLTLIAALIGVLVLYGRAGLEKMLARGREVSDRFKDMIYG